LILQGSSNHLKNPKIKSLAIELNENFKEQLNSVFDTMEKNNFNFKHKKRAEYLADYKDLRMKKIYNYVFER
jgi:hypothetical protein